MAKPAIVSLDDDAGMLRAVEPEPKSGLKHQVTLGDLYETGLAAILFTKGAMRNYLSIRSWVTPSPGPPRLEKAPVVVHRLPLGSLCGNPSFRVIPRSRRRRGISHCLENTQSEIPRSARNDSLGRVITQTPLGELTVSLICCWTPGELSVVMPN